MVTVSPGSSDDNDDDALRSIVVDEFTFTATSAPLEFVT
jgi:hypothetical protein